MTSEMIPTLDLLLMKMVCQNRYKSLRNNITRNRRESLLPVMLCCVHLGNTDTVPINPDGSCGGNRVCEYRWQAVAGMAGFRKAVNGESKSAITTVGNGV